MKTKKVFCEECRAEVNYIEESILDTGKIKEKEYSYVAKKAHCTKCGAELFIPELFDSNLLALYNVYRKENGIISLEEIREIPKKYSIGKRPLSILLGWGEQTFSRYFDGDLPTKQYSDILSHLYNNPSLYAEILEENKTKLNSIKTYEKSRKAVEALLFSKQETNSKINTVLQYILYQCEDITPLALQKALYYIQGFYFAFYKTFLFSEDCEAWIHGPVYKSIYLKYKDYHYNSIEKSKGFNTSVLTSKEKAIYDSIINNVCCYSGKILERFTHLETPWLTTRKDLPSISSSNLIIEKSLIGTYFSAIKEKYNMVNPGDIKEYTKEMFSKI